MGNTVCSAIPEGAILATGLGESFNVWILAKGKIRPQRRQKHKKKGNTSVDWRVKFVAIICSKFYKIAGVFKIHFHNTWKCDLQERVIIWVTGEKAGKVTYHSVYSEKKGIASFLVLTEHINKWAEERSQCTKNYWAKKVKFYHTQPAN